MPDDPRKRVITVSLTAEQWDSGHFSQSYNSYARDSYYTARAALDAAVEPGHADRLAIARAEFEAARQPLTRAAKTALTRKAKTLLQKYRAGTLRVDHLGYGEDNTPDLRTRHGWDLVLIPSTFGGRPAFHFYTKERSFAGKTDHMPEADGQWLIALTKRITERSDVTAWNLPPTTWVSVAFDA